MLERLIWGVVGGLLGAIIAQAWGWQNYMALVVVLVGAAWGRSIGATLRRRVKDKIILPSDHPLLLQAGPSDSAKDRLEAQQRLRTEPRKRTELIMPPAVPVPMTPTSVTPEGMKVEDHPLRGDAARKWLDDFLVKQQKL
jgi:hypothetical protein